MGFVKGYDSIEFKYHQRRGWFAVQKPINHKSPAAIKRAREGSLAVKGAALFNLIPQGLRHMASDHQEQFKDNLDAWLLDIPDQPTIPSCTRAAISNSLLHQVPIAVQQFVNH